MTQNLIELAKEIDIHNICTSPRKHEIYKKAEELKFNHETSNRLVLEEIKLTAKARRLYRNKTLVKLLRESANQEKWNLKKEYPFHPEMPLKIEISYYRKLRRDRKYPTVMPDIDNIGKLAIDALKGTIIEDDNAVTTLILNKRYIYPENHKQTSEVLEITISPDHQLMIDTIYREDYWNF